MPRNSSGTYSLPSGNPVVSNTLIQSTWANTTLSDVSTAVTDSLDRNGRGAMLAPLKNVDGTNVAPAYTFSSEGTLGMFRAAAGTLAFAVAGAAVLTLTTAGPVFALPLVIPAGSVTAPSLTFAANTNTGLYSPATNQVALTTNGVQRLLIDAAGLVTLAGSVTMAGQALTFTTAGANVIAASNAAGTLAFQTGGANTRFALDAAGNAGLGTASPAGKLSVVSASSAAITTGAWTNAWALFGPNAASTTGAALALGYNTTLDQGEIGTLAPSSAWKTLAIFGNGLKINTINGAPAIVVDNAGNTLIQNNSRGIGQSSTANTFSIFAGPTLVDGVARMDLWGSTSATTPSFLHLRGSQVVFTSPTASVEYGRFDASGNLNIGATQGGLKVYVSGSTGSTSVNVDDTNASGFQSYRLGNGTGGAAGAGAALHHMNASYATGSGYFPNGTTLTGFGSGGLNLSASNTAPFRVFVNGGQMMQVTTGGIYDGVGNELGYKGLPQNLQGSPYVLVAGDRGKQVYMTISGVTIPSGVFSTGDCVTILNGTSSSIVLAQGAGTTVYQCGTANTGNRSILVHGIATIVCISANAFFVSGNIV